MVVMACAAAGVALHHAVDALGAADVGHAEAGNAGEGAEAVDLLLNGHEREEIVDALGGGEIGIVEWVMLKVPLIDLGHGLKAAVLGERGNDKHESAKQKNKAKFHLDASSIQAGEDRESKYRDILDQRRGTNSAEMRRSTGC